MIAGIVHNFTRGRIHRRDAEDAEGYADGRMEDGFLGKWIAWGDLWGLNGWREVFYEDAGWVFLCLGCFDGRLCAAGEGAGAAASS